MKLFSTILLFLCLGFMAKSQQLCRLHFIAIDKDSSFFKKQFAYKSQFNDTLALQKEVAQFIGKLRERGYLGASLDSFSNNIHYIYVGEKFNQLLLQNGNVDDFFLDDIGMKHSKTGKLIEPSSIEIIKVKLLQACENNGYPFAEVYLDSFQTEGKIYSAKIFVTRHELIRYDSLQILGKTKVKRIFLRNYLGIKYGKAYNEANVKRVTQRINELQFVEQERLYNVAFDKERARVNVFLKDKKASQFDLLVGLLPGSSGQKVLITGDAKIHLFSPLGLGEEVFLQWQKLQPQTQTLDVRIIYPYVVGLPLGINIQFQLYKKDTSYLDLMGDYGVQYQLLGSNYLKGAYRQRITIMQEIDTNFIKANRVLPQNQDLSTNQFSLELFLQRLNYRFNPISGYIVKAELAAGVRSIKKNNTIIALGDELNVNKTFAALYDTIRLNSFQLNIGLSIEKYWKLAKRQTIKTALEGKYFYAPKILDNEKYRIGGIGSLRGFDDRSIFTPYYLMANLEYRYLLQKNSFFYVFFNAAMVEDGRANRKMQFDFPFGFGAGAAFETKIGIFGLSYAMGQQLDNKLSFRSGKIHFGYVNYF